MIEEPGRDAPHPYRFVDHCMNTREKYTPRLRTKTPFIAGNDAAGVDFHSATALSAIRPNNGWNKGLDMVRI